MKKHTLKYGLVSILKYGPNHTTNTSTVLDIVKIGQKYGMVLHILKLILKHIQKIIVEIMKKHGQEHIQKYGLGQQV